MMNHLAEVKCSDPLGRGVPHAMTDGILTPSDVMVPVIISLCELLSSHFTQLQMPKCARVDLSRNFQIQVEFILINKLYNYINE